MKSERNLNFVKLVISLILINKIKFIPLNKEYDKLKIDNILE